MNLALHKNLQFLNKYGEHKLLKNGCTFVCEDVLGDKYRHLKLYANIAVFKLLHVWIGWLGLGDRARSRNTL